MNLSLLLDWFRPITPLGWLQAVIAATTVALLVLGVVAHWPRLVPGPLTARERQRRHASPWRKRLEILLVPLLAGGCTLAAVRLVCPPRHPDVLVLHSRARDASKVSEFLPPASAGAQVRDLGPAVDRILDECGLTCRNWFTGNVEERRAIREYIEEQVKRLDAPIVEDRGTSFYKPPPERYAPELVESVELSVVMMAVRQYNAVEVRVAPRPTSGTSSWQVARAILDKRDIPMRLIGEEEPRRTGLLVKKIAGARIEKSGHLVFWALVEGNNPVASTLDFTVYSRGSGASSASEIERLPIRIPGDQYTSRIVPLARDLPSSRFDESLLVSHVPSKVSARVVRQEEDALPPRLRANETWRRALEVARGWKSAGEPALARFVSEFEDMHLAIPEVSTSAEEGPTLVHVPAGASEYIVLGATPQVAHKQAAELRRRLGRPPTLNGRLSARQTFPGLRVHEALLGPGTVFSWKGLGLPAHGPSPSLDLGTPSVVASRPRLDQDIQRGHTFTSKENEVVAWLGAGEDRYLIMHLPRLNEVLGLSGPTAPSFEPLTCLALIRSIAWATAYVRGDIDYDVIGEEEPPATGLEGLSGPVVTNDQLERVLGQELQFWDAVSIGGIGFYLLLLVWRIRRSIAEI